MLFERGSHPLSSLEKTAMNGRGKNKKAPQILGTAMNGR